NRDISTTHRCALILSGGDLLPLLPRLITLRYREPEARRPYRAWAYPWSAWIVAAGAVIFLVGTMVGDTLNGLAAIGLCAAGLVGRAALIPRTFSSSGNFRC